MDYRECDMREDCAEARNRLQEDIAELQAQLAALQRDHAASAARVVEAKLLLELSQPNGLCAKHSEWWTRQRAWLAQPDAARAEGERE